MGNWHCVSSGCAKVVYREYEPPKIRWRYGSEPWQEIIGADDYSLAQPKGQCATGYLLTGRFEGAYENFGCRTIVNWYSNPRLPVPGVILGFEERVISGSKKWVILYQRPNQSTPQAYTNLIDIFYRTEFRNRTNCNTGGAFGWEGGFFSIDSIKRADNEPDNCGDCTFAVTKKGQTVYTETRTVCPEVEKIPCQLSTTEKQIEIEKLPYLERIEVVPFQYSAYKLPGVPTPIVEASKIPPECLNIYNNAIYVIPPSTPPSEYSLNPNSIPFDSFVAQICSSPSCPPPEYQVICDCNNCQSCPDGTCPVECDGQVCCYGSDGVSVQAIALADYCGENL
jgi:hypothetical protein